jgi:hypothetical protein
MKKAPCTADGTSHHSSRTGTQDDTVHRTVLAGEVAAHHGLTETALDILESAPERRCNLHISRFRMVWERAVDLGKLVTFSSTILEQEVNVPLRLALVEQYCAEQRTAETFR